MRNESSKVGGREREREMQCGVGIGSKAMGYKGYKGYKGYMWRVGVMVRILVLGPHYVIVIWMWGRWIGLPTHR